MRYLYGEMNDEQLTTMVKQLHNAVHRLLIYKDENVEKKSFKSDEDFNRCFNKLLSKIGGLNVLLGEPVAMMPLIITLQAALEESKHDPFDYDLYRTLIFDAHGYIKEMFECIEGEGGDGVAEY